MTIKVKKVWITLLSISILLIILGKMNGDFDFARETATYGDYDVPGTESWVMKLAPGTPDLASDLVYGRVHYLPLMILGSIFLVTLFISTYKNYEDFLIRKYFQWSGFVVARLGVFRVSGLSTIKRTQCGTFPFLNCMACEMATGACPIGMIQWSLINGRFPYLAVGIIILMGSLLGRFICGWLCPFGYFSDMLERFSVKKIKIFNSFNYLKFGFLGFIFTAFTWSSAIFCKYLCAAGKIYGLFPYWVTVGWPAFVETIVNTEWFYTVLTYQMIFFLCLFIFGILISGRWFCRYLCPPGAWYGLFNYVIPFKVRHLDEGCNSCDRCQKVCPMGIDLREENFLTVTSCIQCGKCTKLCSGREFGLK